MTFQTRHPVTTNDCWNRIGTNGDRSCPELSRVIHCRNCPVFGAAARAFFDRQPPVGYLDEWARILTTAVSSTRTDDLSMLVFRLGAEWMALRTQVVVEVTQLRPVHSIPHRTNGTLVGMVNLRGRLHLLVSLHGLMKVDQEGPGPDARGTGRDRLVVIQHERSAWVFRAEEVAGVRRVPRSELAPVPSNLANPSHSFSQAVIVAEGRTLGYLDDQRLFTSLAELGT